MRTILLTALTMAALLAFAAAAQFFLGESTKPPIMYWGEM